MIPYAVKGHTVRTFLEASYAGVRNDDWYDRISVTHTHTHTACHISCRLTCTGAGAGNCSECKDGYTMENSTCVGE